MKKILLLFLISTLIISSAYSEDSFRPRIIIKKWPYGKSTAFSFTCDDVSAGYKVEDFLEIEDVLKEFKIPATFFVIPFHGKWDLLSKSDRWIFELKEAEKRGHEIALHGYTHEPREFLAPVEKQKKFLENGLAIMEEAGFRPVGFRAPYLLFTQDIYKILSEKHFLYDSSSRFCLTGDIEVKDGIFELCSGHEYTWYLKEEDFEKNFRLAVREFDEIYSVGGFFPMVTHIKAVNNKQGILFLKRFLGYASKKDVWFATMGEVVQWKMDMTRLHYRMRRNQMGYNIEFSDVPEGLQVEMVLPRESYLENEEDVDVVMFGDTHNVHYVITFNKGGNKSLNFIFV